MEGVAGSNGRFRENRIMKSFRIYSRDQILFKWLNQEELSGVLGAYGTERNACPGFGRNPKVKGPLDDLDRDAQEILKWISKKYYERAWTGLMWFRIRIREVLLCTW